jgi:hypothetical protein
MPKLFRQDLIRLHEQWLEDARILLAAHRYPGAYQAGGIALECALKARIAKSTQAEEFPDRNRALEAWVHEPAKLLSAAGLDQFMDAAPKEVRTNWATVKDWKVDSRYTHTMNPATVEAFLNALDDATDGVITWLRNHF